MRFLRLILACCVFVPVLSAQDFSASSINMAPKALASSAELRSILSRELETRFGLKARDGSKNWQYWELETIYNTLDFAGFSPEFFAGIELSLIQRDARPAETDRKTACGVYYEELPRGAKYIAVFDGLYETDDPEQPPKTSPARRLSENIIHEIAHAWQSFDQEMDGKDFQYSHAPKEVIERRLKSSVPFAGVDFLVKQGRKFSSLNAEQKTIYMTGVLAEGNLNVNRRVNEFSRLSGWQAVSFLTGEKADFREGSLDGLYAFRGKPLRPETIPTEYGRALFVEDFAESVRFYVFRPQELLRMSPEKYRYIREKVFHGKEFSGSPGLPSAD